MIDYDCYDCGGDDGDAFVDGDGDDGDVFHQLIADWYHLLQLLSIFDSFYPFFCCWVHLYLIPDFWVAVIHENKQKRKLDSV